MSITSDIRARNQRKRRLARTVYIVVSDRLEQVNLHNSTDGSDLEPKTLY